MRLILAVLALLLVVPVARAETYAIGSGDLRARVESDPWSLAFVDADGEVVVDEASAMPLGVRTATGWAGAVRATSVARVDGALLAEVETAGPLPARLRVRIRRGARGSIAVEATPLAAPGASALGIGFGATSTESFYGLGERPQRVDHRGAERVETYVADGPYYPDAERAVLAAFVPPPGYRQRDDATYFPIPWVLSSEGYGVLVENEETAYHDFGADRHWSLEVTTAPDGVSTPQEVPASLRFRVFGGGTPRAALRRFTGHVGRQPAPAAPWVWGAWFQPGGSLDEQIAQLEKLRAADAPVSVMQTYLHYLPCGDHVGGQDAERERVDAFHARGTAVTTYFNPMICVEYQPRFDAAAAAGALAKDAGGDPYTYTYASSPTSRFDVGQFDFSAPAGRTFYADLLAEAVADGHDGWMEDFGEYTPLDSHYANGMDGTRMHNLYPTQYHCTAYDFVRAQSRPIVRFQRSGFTGAARCAQVVWSGDPTVGWDFDGLASQVKGGLSMGLSGVSTWGSDIGGFFALGTRELSDELLTRWVQFGAVSPVMRMQRNGVAFPPRERPQAEDDGQIANWRRYAKLHTRLFPYLQAADRVYRRTGLPIMRHLALMDPSDELARVREDQYLFGPDLLAAPVVEPGVTEREVYLPRGRWVEFWRALSYRERSGSLRLRRAPRVQAGGHETTVPAPLHELPLFLRAGAVLPLLPADVDTLADYGPGRNAVPLSHRRGRLDLIAVPRGRWRGKFHRGETLVSRERRGRWELTVRGQRRRRYAVQASLATLRRPFRPCTVTVGNRRARFRYARKTRALRVAFTARRTTVVAASCRN
ncbi:MAG TPA: TIM-barrel domain-containing protein [Thermoleophilaceae bacterium]|nr:TIM-barrel domain-containing protein [Thermoleophilaceae bacterium]